MLIPVPAGHYITEEEYLAGEELSEVKHEYCDGQVFPMGGATDGEVTAMAGATDGHELVAGNFFGDLWNHLRGSGCRTYKSDMKVRVQHGDKLLYYYPDVLVACTPIEGKATFHDQPKLIIEVLSSDWRKDLAEKLTIYRSIPSLEEYVVANPLLEVAEVFIHRRADGWEPAEIVRGLDAEFMLRSVGLTMKMAALFAV